MNFELLFAKAKAKGIEDVQVFLVNRSELSIEVFSGEVDKYEIADTASLSIKGVYNKKLATVTTEDLRDARIDELVDNLIQNASIIDSPDEAIIYAGDPKYETLEGAYQPELANLDVAKKIAMVKDLDKLFHSADPRITIAETMYSETTRSVLLQNTKGLKLENKVNTAMLGGSIIAKDETDQRTGFDLVITNELSDMDLPKLACELVSDVVKKLGAKPIPSKSYEILFRNDAFATLMSAFSGVFSAEAVQKNMSLLKGKLNAEIGSPLFTLADDPFLKKSPRSRSFDDEGVATRYKEVVKNGVLTTYLHNLTTAKKDGVSSTGNASGTSVASINFVIQPGKHPFDELIASTVDGILITDLQGAHAGANPVSGDFSLQASGFVVENGKIGKPVALITVAGNFIGMLKDIVAVGNDLKSSYYGITSPSIKIRSMAVAGI